MHLRHLEDHKHSMMAALAVPEPPTEPRRVKVYELKNNDWFDRGTGFATGQLENVGHQSTTRRPFAGIGVVVVLVNRRQVRSGGYTRPWRMAFCIRRLNSYIGVV
jgi:hypothetical protein